MQKITPNLWFDGNAREAAQYYIALLGGEMTGPALAESLAFAEFTLLDQPFIANDAGVDQDYSFSEAFSFAVTCKDQGEIDYLSQKLSAHPEKEQYGWYKDKFGISWQIIPGNMGGLMQKSDVYATLMQQKKISLE